VAEVTVVGLLDGKRGVVLGVANERSIGWGIARAAHREGARLGLSYLNKEDQVRELAPQVQAEFLEPLDVGDEGQIAAFFRAVRSHWGEIDFVVHSIAYANKDALMGRFSEVGRQDFLQALDISCYSFLSVARHAAPLLRPGGSLLTLSYLGAVRAVPNYHLMGVAKAALEATTRYLAADLGPQGIRVNAISSGPILTLAASAISNFRTLLRKQTVATVLKRGVTQEDVGNSALYFLSDLASAVSGEIHYVDAGYNISMCDLECPAGNGAQVSMIGGKAGS